MKNIIKHILALTIIFIILLVIGIIYSITNTAKAISTMFQNNETNNVVHICEVHSDVYGHATNTFKNLNGRCKIKSSDTNTMSLGIFWYRYEETDSGSMFLTVVDKVKLV